MFDYVNRKAWLFFNYEKLVVSGDKLVDKLIFARIKDHFVNKTDVIVIKLIDTNMYDKDYGKSIDLYVPYRNGVVSVFTIFVNHKPD